MERKEIGDSIEKLREKISGLKEKVSSLSDDIKKKKEKLSPAIPGIDESKPEDISLPHTSEVKALVSDLHTFEKHRIDLEQKLSGLTKNNEELNSKLEQLNSENQDYRANMAKLADELNNIGPEASSISILNTINEFVDGLTRYFRDTRGMIKEILNIFSDDKSVPPSIRNKIELLSDKTTDISDVLGRVQDIFRYDELKFVSVNFGEFIEDIVKNFFRKTLDKKININRKFPKEPVFVSIDTKLITEMVMSMLENSLEAIEKSGAINIAVEVIDSDKILLEISDTGEGIPPHLVDKVFRPFLTLKDGRFKPHHPGLGLTKAYWIAKLHKGDIKIASKLKEGTIVKITLPIKQG